MKTSTSKAVKPKHAIGTHFQKKFLGYGVWEGRITSFDGEDYEVRYLEDNYIEFISEKTMDEIITKSNQYVQMRVKVETVQNQPVQRKSPCSVKRLRIPTDRYAMPVSSNIKKEQQSTTTTVKKELSASTSTSPSFTVGQHVWVSVGREMHSAKIKCILPSNMAKVQWTTMLTYATVSMDDIKPMFDSKDGEFVSSKFSKRKRGHTQRFVPPLPTKQERKSMMSTPQKKKVGIKRETSHHSASKKKQYSPTQRRNKKAASKRAKSPVRLKAKQYPRMKREPRDDLLPKQKSKEELRLEKEKEEEYKLLWELYLMPKVRKNEELPGGMCLRQKKAICGLLRCKTSLFRKQLHKIIIRLEKEGKKDEIHRMLTQMREHDETGAPGDGPKELMEEILDFSAVDNDEVAFVASNTASPCVKRECETFYVEKPQPKAGVNVNTSFEPIAAMEKEKDDFPGKDHDLKVTLEGTDANAKKGGINFDAAKGKRAVCSPSIADCIDELEPKRFKRTETEESTDNSTVSSLTFPGGESIVCSTFTPPIPTEITIRRRPRSIRTAVAGAQISNDARETPSTNAIFSTEDGQTMSQAESSEKKQAAARSKPEYIDLSETNSDQTTPYRGDIHVDTKVDQVKRRRSSAMNDVIVID